MYNSRSSSLQSLFLRRTGSAAEDDDSPPHHEPSSFRVKSPEIATATAEIRPCSPDHNDNTSDSYAKKVSFSQAVKLDTPGAPIMESPPKKLSIEEMIEGLIRDMRTKVDKEGNDSRTFPPCVAHGLAVRMDTVSRSLAHVQSDLVEIKRGLARVLDQQDIILRNTHNHYQNHHHHNNDNNKKQWQDDEGDDNENDDDQSLDESDNGKQRHQPSELDMMLMMLGQSNNIFYSRQPAGFYQTVCEGGILPGPYCRRPLTPPPTTSVEALDDEQNNNNTKSNVAAAAAAKVAECGSPPLHPRSCCFSSGCCDNKKEEATEVPVTVVSID